MSPRKKRIVTVLVIAVVLVSAVAFFLGSLQPQRVHFSMNAAIIDQLALEFPNPAFRQNITAMLVDYGFNVSYHNDTDVDFFKSLARSNYGVIILRAHMALRDDNSSVDIFTSELYDYAKYRDDQNAGLLVEGVLNYSGNQKKYFALSPDFFRSSDGNFPRSLVIATGCWSLKPDLTVIADEFVAKGSSVYIGWSDLVGNAFSDAETIKLVQKLVENRTISQSVENAGYPIIDTMYGGEMGYFPKSMANAKLSDLVAESDHTEISALTLLSFNSSFAVTPDADGIFDRVLLSSRDRLICQMFQSS